LKFIIGNGYYDKKDIKYKHKYKYKMATINEPEGTINNPENKVEIINQNET
jgi:hypothetical protein